MSFRVIKTRKQSSDPDFEAKKHRSLHLYGLMDGTDDVLDGDPEVVICVDEFGPLKLQPHPGRWWTTRGGGGMRHLLAAYDLSRDRLYGHINSRKRRGEVPGVPGLSTHPNSPPGVRLGIVLDNFSPHLSTRFGLLPAGWTPWLCGQG